MGLIPIAPPWKKGLNMVHKPDTMVDAIAMSSPSGRMSKAQRKRNHDRLVKMLFGEEGLSALAPKLPPQPTDKERDLRHAKFLRELAARGMKPRANIKEAERLEAKYV